MSDPAHMRADNRPLGVFMMILGIFVLSITDAAGKWVLVEGYHVIQLNVVRGLFGLLILIPFAMKEGGLASLKTARPVAHLLRSALLVCMAYGWFYSLTTLPLADATAVVLCAPLFMTALAHIALGERAGIFRWSAILVGFAGMLLVIRPGTAVFDPMFLLPAIVALGYATYMITNRILSRTETATAITLYPQFAVFAVSAILVAPFWRPLTWPVFGVMVVTGVTAGIAHLCLTYAFKYAPPTVLAPFDYTGLLWATLFGYFIFGQSPDAVTWTGAALIVLAGLVVIYREAVTARRNG